MWIFILTVSWILAILLNIIFYTQYYFTSRLSLGSFSQVLYTLQNPMEGSENTWSEAVSGFFIRQWPWLILATLIYAVLIYIWIASKKEKLLFKGKLQLGVKKLKVVFLGLLAVLVALNVLQSTILYRMFGIDEYNESLNQTSDLYERFYADPRSTKITFPDKKNLVYILCESMESTFAGQDEGGGFKKSLIPELSELAKDNTDFSADPDVLNGGLTPGNTGWTIAGIVAQSMGVPLNIGNGDFNRNFEDESQFLPHLTGMGEILQENGYSNYFMCGSEAAFGGRKNYFEQHGDYEIFDYFTAKKDGIIDQDYRVWWGMEDNKLYTYAKKELTEISKADQPFNFTMLTVDTHFTDGYKCPDCPDEFDTQYENVIHCSDHKVAAFVKWIQQQDWYEDTTIVIAGDHKSMDGMVNENIPEGYERKTFFTVINGPEYKLNRTRQFATLDIYPTIIEALGATIDGDRLGLGTSLYANKNTLVEEMGFEELNRQMNAKSEFYDTVILNGDESKLPKEEEPDKEEEDDTSYQTKEPVGITAQEYEQNRDNFANPDYVWTPPVTYPDYSDPGYTEPVVPDPGYTPDQPGDNTGGNTTPETPPTTGGDNSPTPGGDNTGGNTGGDNTGGTTTPETPPTGGDNTGGTTTPEVPPVTGGDSGTGSEGTQTQSQSEAA